MLFCAAGVGVCTLVSGSGVTRVILRCRCIVAAALSVVMSVVNAGAGLMSSVLMLLVVSSGTIESGGPTMDLVCSVSRLTLRKKGPHLDARLPVVCT